MTDNFVPRRQQAEIVEQSETGGVDPYQLSFGVSFEDAVDRARQEFKSEVDVETILRRTTGSPSGRISATGFGSAVDYDVDLQAGLEIVRAARQEWQEAPKDLRERYRTFMEFFRAVERGEVATRAASEEAKPEGEPKGESPPSVSE